ncbi:MAG: hypothetical protein P8Z00_17530 [Anaerolineales bacterium]|jgi:hypothetical protein
MSQMTMGLTNRRLKTPRAAAIAGILFAVLFSTSMIMIRLSVPGTLADQSAWLENQAGRVILALRIFPFAGIAFLWFLGVVRDRLGEFEDRFFSTVFFGSGLLFLAMSYIAAAVAAGILTTIAVDPTSLDQSDVLIYSRAVMYHASNVYGIRMAGVFMLSTGTIWIRTQIMPRWLTFLTYGLALVLLLGTGLNLWMTLIFPGWVFVVSVYILILNYRRRTAQEQDGLTVDVEPATQVDLD